MALTATYTAQLRTLSMTASGFVDEARAQQGYIVSGANRVGLVCFPDLNLAGKTITGISLTVTSEYAGSGSSKTAYLYQSTVQGTATPTANGNTYIGSQIGSFEGYLYGNTATFTLSGTTLSNIVSYLSGGKNTLVLYESNPQASSKGWSKNYFLWTAATMTVTYQEQTSQPTTDKSSADIWSDIVISTNRESTSATHTLRYAFGSLSGTIAESVTDSYTWTVPSDFMMQIPNTTSGTCTVYCDTYMGGSLVGTKSVQFTATMPSWVNPAVSSVSAAEATSGLADKFGAFISGKSALTITVSATGNWGSSPSSIRLAVGNQQYTASNLTIYQDSGNNAATAVFSTGIINLSGSVTLTATVTDTRGRTGTTTQTITVLDYSAPKLLLFTAERCNSDGSAAQSDGTNVRISANASATSLGDKNDMTAAVEYRLKGATAWTSATTLTPSSYLVSVANQKLTQTFDALSTYELRLTVADYFSTVSQICQVGTKSVIIDLLAGGKGVAFGKVAETENTVDFAWDVKLDSPLTISNGGTGATTAAQAAANIGALPTSGGTMTGDINFGNADNLGLQWTTDNGTRVRLRPYAPSNVFQVTMKPDGGSEFGALSIKTDGTTSLKNTLSVECANPMVSMTPTDTTNITKGIAGALSSGTVFLQGNRPDGDYRVFNNNAAASDVSYGLTFTGTWGGTYAGYRVFHEGWKVPMVNLPFKCAYGTVSASVASGKEATLDYSSAGFTSAPCIVANYSTTGSNPSVNGFIKVYNKTATSALLTLSSGSATATYPVDWIAIGI